MAVVSFNISDNNYFIYNQKRITYFLIKNKLFVIEDKCKHRGGPLSLGKINEEKGTIVCPWHKIENCSIEFNKKNIPSILSGNKISVIMKDEKNELSY